MDASRFDQNVRVHPSALATIDRAALGFQISNPNISYAVYYRNFFIRTKLTKHVLCFKLPKKPKDVTTSSTIPRNTASAESVTKRPLRALA